MIIELKRSQYRFIDRNRPPSRWRIAATVAGIIVSSLAFGIVGGLL